MQTDVNDFLAHYGKKGMKWGVRNKSDRTPDVPRKTDSMARKDAKEFARAKMYYGDGAGTRRKLVKATVEARKKKDPNYAKAFDSHLNSQDYSKHSTKAVKERKRTDLKVRTKQKASFLARYFTGERGTQAAIAAVLVAGTAYLASPKAQKFMKSKARLAQDAYKQKKGAKYLNDYFKKHMA